MRRAASLGKVQNLTWKENGKVRENPMSFMPEDLDYLEIDYGWIIRSVIRHRDLEGNKPFKDWDRYPLTVAFTVRGCYQQCTVCGGSCSAMKGFLQKKRAAFRSPEKVAQDIYDIQTLPEGADLRGRGHQAGREGLRGEAPERGEEAGRGQPPGPGALHPCQRRSTSP